MILDIQNALIENGFEKMKPELDKLNINSKVFTSPKGQKILLLDYFINSNPLDKFVKECRGLGLLMKDYSVFRCGFHRFMNYGEDGSDNISFNDFFEVERKEDGSLIFVSYLPEEGWVVGTRGSIFPTEKLQVYNCTIPEAFKQTVNWNEDFENKLNPNYTYCFEFCSMGNRVVVKYETPKAVLLNIVNNKTLVEENSTTISEMARVLNVNEPKVFGFKNIEEIFRELKRVPGIEQEGFVIKQRTLGELRYRRIKMKSDDYRAIHNIISHKSLNNIVRMVLEDKKSEFKDFPEYLETYEVIEGILEQYFSDLEDEYNKKAHLLEGPEEFRVKKKRFAEDIKDNEHKSFLFKRSGDDTLKARDYVISRMKANGIYNKKYIKDLINQLKISDSVGKQWIVVEDDEKDI